MRSKFRSQITFIENLLLWKEQFDTTSSASSAKSASKSSSATVCDIVFYISPEMWVNSICNISKYNTVVYHEFITMNLSWRILRDFVAITVWSYMHSSQQPSGRIHGFITKWSNICLMIRQKKCKRSQQWHRAAVNRTSLNHIHTSKDSHQLNNK